MDIKTFRSSPLSDQVVTSLINATMAQSEWRTILTACTPPDATKDFLTLSELFHHSMYKGSACDFDDVLIAMCAGKITADTSKDIHALQECMLYAKQRFSEIKALTAADLFKINAAINVLDVKIFENENSTAIVSVLVNDVWSILHDLYNPDRQYPLLLEAAIAVYRILTLQSQWKVDLWTLLILLEAVYSEDLRLSGISLQWLTLVNPEKPLSDYDTEQAVLLILSVFENIWRYNCEIYIAMREKEEEIKKTIHDLLPKLYTDKILPVITENICLTNASLCEKAGVAHGTAVNYLKEMERIELLYSQIEGKERLYFNKIICGFAREKLLVM